MPIGQSLFRYTVDRYDLIVDAEIAYDHFSRTHDDFPELPVSVLGTLLSEHITGEDTQKFTADLLALVRASARSLTVPYRCDAPSIKRFLRMDLAPKDAGAVAITHTVVSEEPLRARLRFDATPPTDSVRCSMCNRVRHHDVWREPEEAFAATLLRREHANAVIYKVCHGCRAAALEPAA